MHQVVPAEGEFALVGEDGKLFTRADFEALEAQAEPPEEWTLEEIHQAYEPEGGWPEPDPAWVEQAAQTFSRAYPAQAREFRRVADFVLRRPALVIWVAPRRQQREYRPRRRRVASSPRRARAPGRSADDPSEPSDEPPLIAFTRGFAPASVRMVRHLERRRAKAAAA
jgi:hypothetical protein